MPVGSSPRSPLTSQAVFSSRDGWMDGSPLPGQVQHSSDLGQHPLEALPSEGQKSREEKAPGWD